MSRKRLISPEFFTHGELHDAERASGLPLRVAFAGLWTVADRRGYFRWRPRELKLAVLPYDDVDFTAVLAALETAGFVQRYVVDGKEYARIPSFSDWQSFHPNEKPSDVPEPTNGGLAPTKVRRSNAVLTTAPTAGTVASTTPTISSPRSAADGEFATLWPRYPKRAGGNSRGKALKAFRARRASGATLADLTAGLARYAAFVQATGKTSTQYVMQAATFFGPDEHWSEAWAIPAVVVAPPRGGPTVTEISDQRHNAAVALEEQYTRAAHAAGGRWAKEHPELFAPIKEQVERGYRGLEGAFVALAIKSELTTRCAEAAGFPSFDEWRAKRDEAA